MPATSRTCDRLTKFKTNLFLQKRKKVLLKKNGQALRRKACRSRSSLIETTSPYTTSIFTIQRRRRSTSLPSHRSSASQVPTNSATPSSGWPLGTSLNTSSLSPSCSTPSCSPQLTTRRGQTLHTSPNGHRLRSKSTMSSPGSSSSNVLSKWSPWVSS